MIYPASFLSTGTGVSSTSTGCFVFCLFLSSALASLFLIDPVYSGRALFPILLTDLLSLLISTAFESKQALLSYSEVRTPIFLTLLHLRIQSKLRYPSLLDLIWVLKKSSFDKFRSLMQYSTYFLISASVIVCFKLKFIQPYNIYTF